MVFCFVFYEKKEGGEVLLGFSGLFGFSLLEIQRCLPDETKGKYS